MVCAEIFSSYLAGVWSEDLLQHLDRFVEQEKLVMDNDRYWLAARS
jgi:hypothetical protein